MSEWLHINGTFVCSPNRMRDEYPLSRQAVADIIGAKDYNEFHTPGFGSMLESILWDDCDGVEKFNPIVECRHDVLEGEDGARYAIPIIIPRPYGSEGFGNISANLVLDRGSWGWWFPMYSCSTAEPDVSVFCNMNLRDRSRYDMPYVRLWWNLLNIWLNVTPYGLHMRTWDYEEELPVIFWSGLGAEDLPDASEVLKYFYEACTAYDELYTKEASENKSDGIVQPHKSFQDWYNHVWVQEHGEGPVYKGKGTELRQEWQ